MRRRIRFLLPFLLAGFVTNIVVTVWLFHRSAEDFPVVLAAPQLIFAMPGETGWSGNCFESRGVTGIIALAMFDKLSLDGISTFEPPYWSLTNTFAPIEFHSILDETAYGMPFRSVLLTRFEASGQGVQYSGASYVDHGATRHMPTAVIWPGVMINTLLYAAALITPLALFGGIRFVTRRVRGRCVTCGYDLRGTNHMQCPECGVRLASSEVA